MAAQDAELKLKVSLDLAYFRRQLDTLSQQLGGQSVQLAVKFDKQTIADQYRLLNKYIGRKTFRIEIATNLKAEIENAKKLADALTQLDSARASRARAQTQASGLGEQLMVLTKPKLEQLYRSAANAGILQFTYSVTRAKGSMAAALETAGVDAVAGLLNGLESQDTKIAGAARDLGKTLIREIKDVLGIASPSIVMRRLGDFAAEGFEIGLTRGLDEATNSAVGKMRAMLNALKGEASKFGPALMMAMGGGGGGTGGLREAMLMAGGMGGLFTPETYGQRMKRGGRGPVAGIFGAGGAGAGFAGLPQYSMSGPMGMLPPAGTSLSLAQAARVQQAYARSAARGASVMAEGGGFGGGGGGRVAGGGGDEPPGGGGGFGGGMRQLGRAMGGLNLPGMGIIEDLGKEFAFATRQVLLFGQAYKALSFLQSFPGEVSAAVGQLQSFRNTLGAITPSAEEAAASNEFILSVVDKYNVPLQSAREGFTRLYASMQPAGFAGEEIRNLFTGITQAAATFGMSADKVDRVNYAFAQMASKGQVMSEELKGQLGDVLPGAMAIFAEAAGFEGSDAIQKFSKAMEDGAYKGKAMTDLLKNVGIVLQDEFGPGAEGAARTFQGLINRMQNSMKLLYESFEPVAVGFLNQVVVPLTEGIKTVADGFNSFFTGQAAQTLGGSALAVELEKLKPAFQGIRQNIQDLLPLLKGFVDVALGLGKTLISLAGNPFVGFLARVYLSVMPLVAAFKLLNIQGVVALISSLIRAIPVLVTFNVQMMKNQGSVAAFRRTLALTGETAVGATGKLRLMKVAMATLASTAILAGIGLLIERFMSLKGAIDSVRASTGQMLQSISSMANSGSVGALKNMGADLQKQKQTFKEFLPYLQGGVVGPQKRLTPEVAKKMEQVGLGGFLGKDIFGAPEVKDFVNASKIVNEKIKSFDTQIGSVTEKLPLAQKIATDIEGQTKPGKVTITPGGEDGDSTGSSKLNPYIENKVKELGIEQDLEVLRIQKRALLGEIGSVEAAQEMATLNRKYKIMQVDAEYKQAIEKLANEKLSAGDKQLKQDDLLAVKRTKLSKIELEYDIERLGSLGDVTKAIEDYNNKTKEQEYLLGRYRDGVVELNPAERAHLEMMEFEAKLGPKLAEQDRERLDALKNLTAEYYANADAIKHAQDVSGAKREQGAIGKGLMAGFFGSAGSTYEQALVGGKTEAQAEELARIEEQSMRLRTVFEGIQSSIQGVGSAFGNLMTEGITKMIDGTATAKEVFGDFLKAVGQALQQAAAQMIATYIAIGIARIFAGLGGGGGGYAQGNVKTDAFTSGGIPGLSNTASVSGSSFGGFTGGSFGVGTFANGGVVNGPTLGLVGEGKYNEAIVPLPDGKSIPVQMKGESIGDKMKGSQSAGGPPMLNMSFQTTKFGDTEYVSKDQLEQAMMVTQSIAAKKGAMTGASMAIDKLVQNPSIRKKVGLG